MDMKDRRKERRKERKSKKRQIILTEKSPLLNVEEGGGHKLHHC